MKIFFSMEANPKGVEHESKENLKRLYDHLIGLDNTIHRANYELSENRSKCLIDLFGNELSDTEFLKKHIELIDDSDYLLADIAVPSEGRTFILQRAMDRYIPTILIKNKKIKRDMGRMMKGLLESDLVNYFEYGHIDEVINGWEEISRAAYKKIYSPDACPF